MITTKTDYKNYLAVCPDKSYRKVGLNLAQRQLLNLKKIKILNLSKLNKNILIQKINYRKIVKMPKKLNKLFKIKQQIVIQKLSHN